MDVSSPGPLCEKIDLYAEVLTLDSIELMPTIDHKKASKVLFLN